MVSEIIRLKNGLRLLLAESTDTAVATVLVYANAGSRFEKEEETGISHFIEHMFFTGTVNRPSSNDIAKEIDAIGADFNAHPSEEFTSYYIKAASEHLEKVIDVLSDMLCNSKLDEKDLEKEKKVVIEELKLHEDMPISTVNDIFSETIFAGNPLSKRIGGTLKTISSLSRENLVDYRNGFYSKDKILICVSGNFGGRSKEEIINLIEEKFTFPEPSGKQEVNNAFSQKPLGYKIQNTNQTNIIAGFYGPNYNDPDRMASKLLSIILGGNMSSRMFEQIREKKGLAYDVRTYAQSLSDIGIIYTNAGVANDKVGEALLEILKQYQKIKSDITEEELQDAKTYIVGQMKIALEDSYEIAGLYLTQALLGGKIKSVETLFEEINAVTKEDIARVASKYFVPEKLSISFVGPETVKAEIDQIIKVDKNKYLS